MMLRATTVSHRSFAFFAFAALLACGSKDASTKTSTGYGASVASSSGAGATGSGGQGAGVPGCESNGAGGASVGGARLGLRAEPRASDEAAILALGGKPYPSADLDRAEKNAFLRVELEVGPEPGKTTKLRMDHRYHDLGATNWPTSYDAWSAGNDRRLVLSIASADPKLGAISYCELASRPTMDAAISAAAARLRTFVDDNVKDAVYLAWGHDRLPVDRRPKLTVVNSVTFTGTPNKVVVKTRDEFGVACPIPKGTQLVFTSPDGTSSVTTLTHQAAAVDDPDVSVNAVAGTIEPGWTVTYQTPEEQAASYASAWKKARAAMLQAWGGWPGKSKVRWTWVVPYEGVATFEGSYPGDDQVDTLGLDAINLAGLVPNAPWTDLAPMLVGIRSFAEKHGGKEIVVATTASLDGGAAKTTAPSLAGPMVTLAVEKLGFQADAGTEVLFYGPEGALLGKGALAMYAGKGAPFMTVASLDVDLPAGTSILVRLPGKDKSLWVESARAAVLCAPEITGVIWYTGTPGGFWLDQGPEASPAVLETFKAWANDPYFGG
jgi:hypothetical protein